MPMDLKHYNPQISPGNNNLTPPPSIIPSLIRRNTVILTYPYTSPTLTLELRSPEFQNKEAVQLRRVNRRTRNNDMLIFNDRDWPQNHILNFVIGALPYAKVLEVLAFVDASLGVDIGYLDYESQQWKGIILNPDSVVTDVGKQCNYTAEFTFQGEVV